MFIRLRREINWWKLRFVNNDKFKNNQLKRQIETKNGYSMKPLDDNKVVFIHIPKCAGISINKLLYGNLGGGHTTLTEYSEIFEPAKLTSYFKFTIVRNPWERLVSAYFFLKNGGMNAEDNNFYEQELKQYNNFDCFVREWVNKKNIDRYYHFRSQCSYFIDDYGLVEVDYIARLENLTEDLLFVGAKLNKHIQNNILENKGTHKNYIEYYSEITKEIVAKVYADDIAVLGYDFENITVSRV